MQCVLLPYQKGAQGKNAIQLSPCVYNITCIYISKYIPPEVELEVLVHRSLPFVDRGSASGSAPRRPDEGIAPRRHRHPAEATAPCCILSTYSDSQATFDVNNFDFDHFDLLDHFVCEIEPMADRNRCQSVIIRTLLLRAG